MAIVDTDMIELPSDPALRKRLTNGIQELIDSFTRVAAEKELQKEIIKTVAEDTGVKKGDIRKLANMKFKGNKDKVAAQTDAITAAYEILYESPNAGVTISAAVVASSSTTQAQIDAADAWGVEDDASQ